MYLRYQSPSKWRIRRHICFNTCGNFTKYPKAPVIIALLELEAAKRAAENVSTEHNCGTPFLLMEEIVHYFMTKICSRGVNSKKYLNTLKLYGNSSFNGSIVSPTLSFVMTEKCSLNCEHCGACARYRGSGNFCSSFNCFRYQALLLSI